MANSPLNKRRSGVLLHISSLYSRYGQGDLGHEAYRFVDFLAQAGCSVWQMLPLGPTHADRSPYNALSVHAGNPLLLSLDWLVDRGWLDSSSCEEVAAGRLSRFDALAGAARRFIAQLGEDQQLAQAYAQFCASNAWLDDFAGFVAIRDSLGGAGWTQWPSGLRDRDPEALRAARERLAERVEAVCFEQYCFDRQWSGLRDYAAQRGVLLFGDVPIFVSHDSADVWAHRRQFRLDQHGAPTVVAGVPPDYFAQDGQRWGNPHYDWELMRTDGYGWWRARLKSQRKCFDLIRIDHFRGFEACWEIPVDAPTAREGRWVPGPGDALLDALRAETGEGVLIAEDLGIITDDVIALRDRHALPGMVVLQFAFGSGADNAYLPHNHAPLSVVYTGTHDNDTTQGWFDALDDRLRGHVYDYLGGSSEPMPWALIRSAFASVARLAVVPCQDLLGLGSAARMNTPGVSMGNWAWQMQSDALSPELAARVRSLNTLYGRLG